ncbi:MAG: DUF4352 domain-containing protein [Lachnospiraceae bacterium]|nr:DUF4352 domain-containing protein [Lachnospiraceae bacterium]
MKKMFKIIVLAVCLTLFAAMALGSSSETEESKPQKVGEVKEEVSKEEEKTEETEEPAAESEEVKSEYHVGDTLKDGDLSIVYAASGEYKEENEYMQPAEGNKLVFIKLSFENQGDSDVSVSSYSFHGYADGYEVETHYTDDDFSATLSKGRTTEGVVVFEVPKDAKAIEIEYDTNVFTDEKLKLIYDGDKDSGFEAKANTETATNAFSAGDIVESDNMNITYISCEKDKSDNQFIQPKEGFHYVTLKFEFENKGDSDEYISCYDFDCYADGKDCEQAYFRDDNINATLSSGRKAQGTVTFEVPDDATTVEAEFVSNVWTSDRVVFKVTE